MLGIRWYSRAMLREAVKALLAALCDLFRSRSALLAENTLKLGHHVSPSSVCNADHANPCQLPLLRALTESQALHTPHGIIAAYNQARRRPETLIRHNERRLSRSDDVRGLNRGFRNEGRPARTARRSARRCGDGQHHGCAHVHRNG